MPRELYRVFVDETGDRGWGGSSSPIFVTSAVIVRDEDVPAIAQGLEQINSDLRKPKDTVLHFAENVKAHSQRKHVASFLAGLPMVCTSVVVMKEPLMGSGTQMRDATTMYNYCVRRLLERVSWFVDDNDGEAIVTFAHVRNFPYARLHSYVKLLTTESTQIRWDALRLGKQMKPRIEQPNRVRLLQVADLVAGCIGAAVRPDRFGRFEPVYLMELVPRIYIRGRAKVTSYGLNVVGPSDCMDAFPWWEEFINSCRNRS